MLDRLNALPEDAAEAELLTCCASRRWAAEVAAGRPYDDPAALAAASAKALDDLDWADVREALDAHPRIGDRAKGEGREARWSRGEQSGAASAADETKRLLLEGNRAYEERFGHVFLICATGRTAEEILADLRVRLGHDAETERSAVRAELAAITGLRLAKLIEGPECRSPR
ncbi:2-oxo-4-hydroxy-4-carboxy-5-ureidoimidazoline decarboxylase [Actinomadura rupiterrae]|uniref:2-oxo-4-hydroxy-4-carboxy-5-ureidoimidazoline decarboxylase n=1 Tax=Actinomadura rupiterrae TaxID=559627 RepID=UPI0020A59729|nr:2-oxo-4-hydroxy-4-carboxy-5-ureidoimidazoline decarboxylase [Actinomadura rupiterrae]MCP2339994.1 2-oxo-4-hydroxy-4-carboxy-5-ureidoimidazoline decarboxylase [Actinomadura rupiterrae]